MGSKDRHMSHTEPELERVGRGRSAEVFAGRDAEGRAIVRKIFLGEAVSKAVLFLLTGSANPYTWCEPAIRAAVARRRILTLLVTFWFGGKLRLPRTDGWSWNEEHRAFELRSELIEGSHAPLRGPEHPQDRPPEDDPVHDLVHTVMRPLQQHLEEAGFDGLVWQAGRGNPVAANNFMLEGGGTPDARRRRWVWIDLESGVPALFALDPTATLGFYLPRSLRHRRWLFDDVDIARLRRYLERHRLQLASAAGEQAVDEVLAQVEELDRQQHAWRSIPRHRRGIAYELSRQRLSPERAEWYGSRPMRWAARAVLAGATRGARGLIRRAARGIDWLRRLDLRHLGRGAWRFAASQRYRAHVARMIVLTRLRGWSERRFLDRGTVRQLRGQLRHDDDASYITDFGVHLAIKPLIKPLQWFALPPLVALGVLDPAAAAFLWVTGGLIGRTLYTAGRFVQASLRRQRRPWLALGVGLLPVVGNAAYPAQLLYCSTEETDSLARFILYDTLATIGRSVPVWGGADSLIEHGCNRLGDLAVRWLGKPIELHPAQPALPIQES